jgi:hypothetical protein
MGSNLIATIIVVAVVVAIVLIKKKQTKNSSWKGEVIKKKDISDEDNENHVYRLIFKTDDGKKAKLSVSEEVYNQAKVGDRYEKLSGDNTPKKI